MSELKTIFTGTKSEIHDKTAFFANSLALTPLHTHTYVLPTPTKLNSHDKNVHVFRNESFISAKSDKF